VDHLSGGRADMGVAKGFVPHEFEAFHIDQSEVPDRIAEGLDICQKFWAGEPFAHDGKFFNDTEEQAIDEAKSALQEHAGAFGKVMRGQQWDRDYEDDISVLLHMCEDDDWRDVFRRRTLICSPEQAAERIQRYLDLGFTEISFITRYAGLTNEQNMTTIRRISEEVLPMLGLGKNTAE